MTRILVVDDEVELRASVERILRRAGHEVDTAANGTDALAAVGRLPYDLMVTDFKLPDLDGIEVMRQARRVRPDIEVVLMTAFANIPLAVEAIKQGAYDFIPKPFKRAELERVVARALERQALSSENRRLRMQLGDRSASPLGRMVGQSHAVRRVLDIVAQVAPSSATVLILGESGTGKELVADAIHAMSPRRARALVKVNCAAIPDTLLEAELFGYERGAFTGAATRKEGRFAAATGGTLFLDEVGTMSLPVQAKLLRVLQDGAFEPLGSNRTHRADCRLVAATNSDIRLAVQEGRFREDLYYRLNVIAVSLPPLRDRREDIPLLAQHFLLQYSAKDRKAVEGISPEALAALQGYGWPGNVRELEHAVERAVVLARGRFIEVEHLPDPVRALLPTRASDTVDTIAIPVGTPLDTVERLLIGEALRRTGGNRQKAAGLLGIATRTIYRKLGTRDA